MKAYIVKTKEPISIFLEKQGYSTKEIKNLLKYRHIKINHRVETNYHRCLKEKDQVEIVFSEDFDILYEDSEFLVVNKKAHLLTISTEKEKENTLYHKVREYVNKKHEKLFILHRLDKETSGIVVFVKNEKLRDFLQKDWNRMVLQREYYAICEGIFSLKKKTISVFLKENKNHFVYVSKTGKKAITSYEVIKEKKNYSLVRILLSTGRKNQIRVTFAFEHHPILGDEKYGSGKKDRLYLHASSLSFRHPKTKKVYTFKAPVPFSL